MKFPMLRMRRFRRTPELRALVRETHLSPEQLVQPLFVCEGAGIEKPIGSMPGHAQLSTDLLALKAGEIRARGIGSVILFGIPERKDTGASEGVREGGLVPRAIRALKEAHPELVVWADVCLCEYTDHGHCGVLKNGEVDNDATLPLLAQMSVACARAGADIIAPSDMMDGRVAAIRDALDEADLAMTPICAYAAKYASAFYGPFREAAESAPREGDRRGYQMDPANALEALREVELDLREGADMVMVKPALACLDVIRRVKDRFGVPVAAYNVSGEFAMLKAAAERGWIDGDRAMLEILTSIRRAGADVILTYHASEIAGLL